MSDLIREHIRELEEIIPRYGIKNIVETGTGEDSSGMKVAVRFRLTGFSCDIFPEYVNRARAMYPLYDIFEGTSLDFLTEVTHWVDGPTLFWMDAHFPQEDPSPKVPMWPLYEELTLLRSIRDCSRDVIWCDDMQHVLDPENPIHDQAVGIDILGGRWPGDSAHMLAEYRELFQATHDAAIVGTVLQFVPKGDL